MFTIKFYRGTPGSPDGYRQCILSADSFTVLRGGDDSAEITLHRKNGDDQRVDVAHPAPRQPDWPDVYDRAIIENAAGKTTEIIALSPAPR